VHLAGSLIAEKILNELMRSVDERMADVRRFVYDIKPNLHYSIVPIVDVYGPAGTDGSIECIVVSQETVRGADAVNSRRAEQVCKSVSVLCRAIQRYLACFTYAGNLLMLIKIEVFAPFRCIPLSVMEHKGSFLLQNYLQVV
jgi:hypothetical protein